MVKMIYKNLKNYAKKKKNLNKFNFINYYICYILTNIIKIYYTLKNKNTNI